MSGCDCFCFLPSKGANFCQIYLCAVSFKCFPVTPLLLLSCITTLAPKFISWFPVLPRNPLSLLGPEFSLLHCSEPFSGSPVPQGPQAPSFVGHGPCCFSGLLSPGLPPFWSVYIRMKYLLSQVCHAASLSRVPWLPSLPGKPLTWFR